MNVGNMKDFLLSLLRSKRREGRPATGDYGPSKKRRKDDRPARRKAGRKAKAGR